MTSNAEKSTVISPELDSERQVGSAAPAFTAGPWREGQDGNCRVYGPDGQGEHSGLIAVVYKGRANVRLIAAAPSMYAALKEILTEAEFVDEAKAPFSTWVAGKVRAALALADTGKEE